MTMKTHISTVWELDEHDAPMVVVYQDEHAGLIDGAGLGMTIRFTAGQIPIIEELLAALIAKRDKTGPEVA
jgi:hypothetical protein